MKKAVYKMNNYIKIILFAMLMILNPSLLFGNDTVSVNNEVTAAGSSISRKGWLAEPVYTQKWEIRGNKGDHLMISTSPISDGIVPEIYLMFNNDDTPIASAINSEDSHLVLDCVLDVSGTYIVSIRDQGKDNEGGYNIFLQKTAAPESERRTPAAEIAEEDDEDNSGLSMWEIGTMASIGAVLSILTGPFAPLAIMIAARIIVLFPV